MTDEEAVAWFPGAKGFMEVTDPSKPLGAWGIVVDKDGHGWAFDGDSPRPIGLSEAESLGARPCKPSDAVELIPPALLPNVSKSNEVLFPANIPPESRPPQLSRSEENHRVQIMEQLEKLDRELERLGLRRKRLVERLGQVPERN